MKLRQLAGSLFAEGSTNVVGSLGATGLSITTTMVLTRGLAKSGYGEYTFAVWLLFTLATLATLGLPSTLVRFLAVPLDEDGREDLSRAGLVGGAMAVATIALAGGGGLLLLWPASRPWAPLILPGAVGVVLFSLSRTLLEARLDYRTAALLAPLPPGLALVSVWLLLAAEIARPAPLVASASAAWATGGLIAVTVVWRRVRPPRPVVPRSLPRGVLPFFFTVSAMSLVDLVVWQRSELFFLRVFTTPTEIAEYSVAYAIAGLVGRTVLLFGAPLLPVFSARQLEAQAPEVRHLLVQSSLTLLTVVTLGCTVIASHGSGLLGLLFGPRYRSAGPVLTVLLVGVGLTAGNGPFSSYLLATGRERFVLGWGFCLAGLNLFLDVLLIPSGGALGAAWANTVTQLGSLAPVLVVAQEMAGPRRVARFALVRGSALALAAGTVAGPAVLLGSVFGPLTLPVQLVLLGLCLWAAIRSGLIDIGPLLRPQAPTGTVHAGDRRPEQVEPQLGT